MFYKIYTDGASRGNPGPSAAGGVIYNDADEMFIEISEYLGIQTNNFAEYMSLVLTLRKAIELGVKNVVVFMDSSLVVNQVNGVWKINNTVLRELNNQVQKMKTEFETFKISHVFRESNKVADKLANRALDNFMNQSC